MLEKIKLMLGKQDCACRAGVYNTMAPTGQRRTRTLDNGRKMNEIEYGCPHGVSVWMPAGATARRERQSEAARQLGRGEPECDRQAGGPETAERDHQASREADREAGS